MQRGTARYDVWTQKTQEYGDLKFDVKISCKFNICRCSFVFISPTHALYIKTLHKHTKIVN